MGAIAGLLDLSEKIETSAARAYSAFSFILGEGNIKQRKFWADMAQEEWEHASLVGSARFLLGRRGALAAPAGFDYAAAGKPILDRIASADEMIRKGGFTLRQAFEAAIEIEESEANRIFARICAMLAEAATAEGLGYLAEAAQAAGSEGSAHVEHLIESMKRTIGDPSLVRAARKSLT